LRDLNSSGGEKIERNASKDWESGITDCMASFRTHNQEHKVPLLHQDYKSSRKYQSLIRCLAASTVLLHTFKHLQEICTQPCPTTGIVLVPVDTKPSFASELMVQEVKWKLKVLGLILIFSCPSLAL
jgi:hypothetical protein